jgi:hypothetical protein
VETEVKMATYGSIEWRLSDREHQKRGSWDSARVGSVIRLSLDSTPSAHGKAIVLLLISVSLSLSLLLSATLLRSPSLSLSLSLSFIHAPHTPVCHSTYITMDDAVKPRQYFFFFFVFRTSPPTLWRSF